MTITVIYDDCGNIRRSSKDQIIGPLPEGWYTESRTDDHTTRFRDESLRKGGMRVMCPKCSKSYQKNSLRRHDTLMHGGVRSRPIGT